MAKRRTGTREWSDHSANCIRGCSNGCLYCYGREFALRGKRIARGVDWLIERPYPKGLAECGKKRRGRVMFPTTHDITPANLNQCMAALRSLLDAGNEVLVVTKPHLACVTRICHEFIEWADRRLAFRFTIGAASDHILRFWEPDAPSLQERLRALAYAKSRGFSTSVSSEPLLEPEHAEALGAMLAPHITDTLWIGGLNHARARTAWCRETPGLEDEIRRIEAWQTPDAIWGLYRRLKGVSWIRWKDQYRKVLGLPPVEAPQ
jgi:DNA repair photolyase